MNSAKTKIQKALDIFYSNDLSLVKNDVGERAITHRIAVYLEGMFPLYNVDCEYNRDGLNQRPKALDSLKYHASQLGIKIGRVYPDIIVHKRGKAIGLIAIELKKHAEDTRKDLLKLKAYKSELGYKHSFLIVVSEQKSNRLLKEII